MDKRGDSWHAPGERYMIVAISIPVARHDHRDFTD
jgi:hypothetical protein